MAKAGQGGLEGIAAALPRGRGLPPVERWNPPFCGDLDMRIAADGTWYYQKTPIGRLPLVKLFASVLKKEGDKYFLVTTVEGRTDGGRRALSGRRNDRRQGRSGPPDAHLPHQCR